MTLPSPERGALHRGRVRQWAVWGVAVALTLALTWCAWSTLDRFAVSTSAVRSLRFTLTEVSWDSSSGRLSLAVDVHNGSAVALNLEELSFSLYRGSKFLVTNPDPLTDGTVFEPKKDSHLKYDLTLDPYYVSAVIGGGPDGKQLADGPWRLRGRALVLMPGVRPKFPVTVISER